MSPFSVLNTVREIKPGASVIASVSDSDGNQFPALAVQRFGNGRSGAMMVGDFWRWGFQNQESHADMDKAWRQLFRWLVTDVPNKIEISAEPNPEQGNGAVRLVVHARDAKFQAIDNATVSVEVQPVLSAPGAAATNAVRLTADASPGEAGSYETAFVPRNAGCYRAVAIVKDENNAEVGRAVAGWSTDLASEEFHSLQPNVALLEEIARKTGGEVIDSSELLEFAKSLPFRHAAVMEPYTAPFWHTPALFLLALTCFAAEWGLRRFRGLP
jgi:hypothetical protein